MSEKYDNPWNHGKNNNRVHESILWLIGIAVACTVLHFLTK